MDNNNFDNEGADFSKFFDKNKSAAPVQPEQSSGFFAQLALTKTVKVLLVVLVLGIIALGAAIYFSPKRERPPIPVGFEFVKTPNQPTRLQLIKK